MNVEYGPGIQVLIFAFFISGLDPNIYLGFKTQVFNFHFLTRPEISFSRFPNFKPKNDNFLVYFNRPYVKAI